MFSVRIKSKRNPRPMAQLHGPRKVKVGFPAGAAETSVIDIALWNNYGTQTIPERPFMDNAMRDNRSKYRSELAKAAKKLLLGQTTLRVVMSKLGILAQGDIQEEITALQNPPNAPDTIRQKGSSNPLIDEGIMRGAVTWKAWE